MSRFIENYIWEKKYQYGYKYFEQIFILSFFYENFSYFIEIGISFRIKVDPVNFYLPLKTFFCLPLKKRLIYF